MDLKKLVADLIESGMTQKEIGADIKRSQSVISDILNGGAKRPTYETARRLQKLHAERMGRARAA